LVRERLERFFPIKSAEAFAGKSAQTSTAGDAGEAASTVESCNTGDAGETASTVESCNTGDAAEAA